MYLRYLFTSYYYSFRIFKYYSRLIGSGSNLTNFKRIFGSSRNSLLDHELYSNYYTFLQSDEIDYLAATTPCYKQVPTTLIYLDHLL